MPDSNTSLTLEQKIEQNIWDHIDDVLKVVKLAQQNLWCWSRNSACKYINVRIDMRDGGCLLHDRDNKRIGVEQLAYQYGQPDTTPPEATEVDPRDASMIEAILNEPTTREAALIGIIVSAAARHRGCGCLACRIRYFVERHADRFHPYQNRSHHTWNNL